MRINKNAKQHFNQDAPVPMLKQRVLSLNCHNIQTVMSDVEGSTDVYIAAYGSLVYQEYGTNNNIALPIEKKATSYSEGRRKTSLKVQTAFHRISSIHRKGFLTTHSRLTLISVTDRGEMTHLYVAKSTAHIGRGNQKKFGKDSLNSAIRALKCREDMTTIENCRSSLGHDKIAYVYRGSSFPE